ncbi:hypothetical protein CsSME_00053868 [Camellia sinensis var. sinensis]
MSLSCSSFANDDHKLSRLELYQRRSQPSYSSTMFLTFKCKITSRMCTIYGQVNGLSLTISEIIVDTKSELTLRFFDVRTSVPQLLRVCVLE